MDLENQKWISAGEPDGPYSAECHFLIDMIPAVTQMKNFDFEFEIEGPLEKGIHVEISGELEEEIVARSNKLYDQETEFPYLCNKHYLNNLFAGTEYTIHLLFKNRRKVITDSFSFITPKPENPHGNWIWDSQSSSWAPPLPPPNPIWDQESGKWIIP